MRILFVLIAVSFAISSCSENQSSTKEGVNTQLIKKDTLDESVIRTEIHEGIVGNRRSAVNFLYFTESGEKIDGLVKGKTCKLKVVYDSDIKKLRENHKIILVPFEGVTSKPSDHKNEFLLDFKPESDTIAFDLYMESDKLIFKEDTKFKERIMLARFHEILDEQ